MERGDAPLLLQDVRGVTELMRARVVFEDFSVRHFVLDVAEIESKASALCIFL